LSPRNDGPLIEGESCISARETGACCAVRGASTGRAGAVSARMGVGGAAGAATGSGFAAGGAGASSVVPHMPQKRFSAEFSFPHRGQRTSPPNPLYRLRYLEAPMQKGLYENLLD
jgi:hypothetical protein